MCWKLLLAAQKTAINCKIFSRSFVSKPKIPSMAVDAQTLLSDVI